MDVREVLNAIFYVLSTGCQWAALPRDLPPRSTVWDYLDLWDWDGTISRIHHALYVECREKAGREASPTTAIIDAQSAKGAVKGGARLRLRASRVSRRWHAFHSSTKRPTIDVMKLAAVQCAETLPCNTGLTCAA